MNKRNKVINLILILILIIVCWVSEGNYIYPVINMNMLFKQCSIAVLLLMSIILLAKERFKIKFDIIALLLLFRAFYYAIIVLTSQYYNYMFQFFSFIYAFLGYLFISSLEVKKTSTLLISKLIIIFSGIQVILCVINSLAHGIPMYLVKSTIKTPLGNNNYLTCYWLLLIPYIYMNEKSEIKKNIYLVFVGILILLARSNSGFITYLLFIILTFLSKYEKKTKKVIICIVAFLSIFMVVNNFGGYFDRILTTVNRLTSGKSGEVTKALNGREELFETDVKLIKQKPLFGWGFKYREYTPSNFISHNWIYESLLTGGIIGLCLQLLCIIAIINYARKTKTKIRYALYVTLLLILIQGLVEPSLGTSGFDLLFWIIIGNYINEIKAELNKNQLTTTEIKETLYEQ